MIEELPLVKQIDLVFREIRGELRNMASGCVFVQIRNNTVGKFGVKHNPLESRDGQLESEQTGLTDAQQKTLRQMAVESLRYKNQWTHGEIWYEFAVRKNMLCVSIQFESSYNMANVMSRYEPKKAYGLA